MFEARKLYGLLFILLVLATAAFGQEFTGNISGRVNDSSGAVIPGVNVTLASPAIQGVRQAVSGEAGAYQFRLLPAGIYTVKFELPGFKTLVREGVIVEVGKITQINASLEVSTQAETVTVTGESPVVDTQTATVGVNFNQALLRDIPNSRDIWIVLAQSPGINTTRYDVGGSTMGTQTGFRAYGTSSQNWFNLDGIVTNDSAGAAGWYFDYGSFQEVQVSSAANAAEVPVPGAFMNTVIKSGGNEFHGRAYIDWEASQFQSKNVSSDMNRTCPANNAASVAAFGGGPCGLFTGDQFSRYNDFNPDAGGPIKKDKLWWYFSWRDQYSDLQTQLGVADTTQTKFGMPGSGSNAGADAAFVTQGGHYTTRLRIPTLKLTWQVTAKNSFQFMWQHSRKKAPYRNGQGNGAHNYIIESTGDQHDPSDGRKWEWTSVLSPRLTMDLKITDSEYVFPIYSHIEKSPISDSSTGFVRGGYPTPNVGWRKHWDWGGNIAYFKEGWGGTHNFKTGYDVYWELGRNFNLTYPGGGYSLSLNNGVPNQFVIKDGPFTTANGVYQNAFFLQDKWQIGRKLTINVGARWDRYASYYPEQGNSHANGIFDITAIKAAYPASTGILVSLNGATSVPRTIVSTFSNWVPRFAISYDVFGNGKTALKASGGKFSWNPSTSIASNANPNVTPTYTFKWDGTLPITQNYIVTAKPTFVSQSVNPSQVIDPNLTNSWTDEYTAGIDQQVIRDLGVRVNYVRKLEQNPYANVNPLRTIDAYTPVTKVDPGRDGLVGTGDDQNITVYNLNTDFLTKTDTLTKNFPGFGSNYSTFEVIATKRMSNRWMAMFSYDKSKRNLRQDVTYDPNVLAWGANRDAHIWDWQLKTVFAYQLPYGIDLTTTFDSQKGETYTRTVTITGLNQGTLSGNSAVNVEPQGKNFYPTSKLWNFRAQKKIKITEHQSIDGMFDLFNITNLNTVIGWTTASNSAYLFQNQINSVINPRIFRLGARYNF